jgi:hypothetical protein
MFGAPMLMTVQERSLIERDPRPRGLFLSLKSAQEGPAAVGLPVKGGAGIPEADPGGQGQLR